jgi:GTPase Era involved in 16S rRNA processing
MSFSKAVIIGEAGNGKSSFLNAIIAIYNSKHELLPTSDDAEGCTKDITPISIFVDEKRRYQFFDTPGMNDGNKGLNEKIRNDLRKEAANTNNRIKCILFCTNATICRLTKSLKEIIIESMNLYPLKSFWDHVCIIKTFVFNDSFKKKKKLEDKILKDEELINLMLKKGIDLPNKLEEFYFNSVTDEESINVSKKTKDELERLLDYIEKLDPLFQHIVEKGYETKIENGWDITYKILEITDFNGKKEKSKQEISRKPHDGSKAFYDKKKYGDRYKKCGTYYQKYISYSYNIDNNGNKINEQEYGEPWPVQEN